MNGLTEDERERKCKPSGRHRSGIHTLPYLSDVFTTTTTTTTTPASSNVPNVYRMRWLFTFRQNQLHAHPVIIVEKVVWSIRAPVLPTHWWPWMCNTPRERTGAGKMVHVVIARDATAGDFRNTLQLDWVTLAATACMPVSECSCLWTWPLVHPTCLCVCTMFNWKKCYRGCPFLNLPLPVCVCVFACDLSNILKRWKGR